MSESPGGIDTGVIDRDGIVKDEPKKVPMVFKAKNLLTGVEREVREDFILLRGVGASEGYLTTNPHFLASVLERGPLAFDEAREQGQDPTLSVMTESTPAWVAEKGHASELKSISVDLEGNIVYALEALSEIEPLEADPMTTLVVEGPNSKEEFDFINQIGFDNVSFYYNDLPQLREAYGKLGFKKNEERTWSFPPPRLLEERLKSLREEDKDSGVYYPELEILDQGEINSSDYVSAFAAGKYPVSGKSFDWYTHDVTLAHFQALMVYGEPLMDLMSNFASAMQSMDTIVLPGYDGWDSRKPNITDLEGKDKDDATGDILDNITDQLIIDVSLSGLNQYSEDLEKKLDHVAYALKKAGRFGNLKLVGDILESGEVTEADQITGHMLADKLITQTRERFAIAA